MLSGRLQLPGEVLGAGWEDLGAECQGREGFWVSGGRFLGAGGNILGARWESGFWVMHVEHWMGSFGCCVPGLWHQLLGTDLGGAGCQVWVTSCSFRGAGCTF